MQVRENALRIAVGGFVLCSAIAVFTAVVYGFRAVGKSLNMTPEETMLSFLGLGALLLASWLIGTLVIEEVWEEE